MRAFSLSHSACDSMQHWICRNVVAILEYEYHMDMSGIHDESSLFSSVSQTDSHFIHWCATSTFLKNVALWHLKSHNILISSFSIWLLSYFGEFNKCDGTSSTKSESTKCCDYIDQNSTKKYKSHSSSATTPHQSSIHPLGKNHMVHKGVLTTSASYWPFKSQTVGDASPNLVSVLETSYIIIISYTMNFRPKIVTLR